MSLDVVGLTELAIIPERRLIFLDLAMKNNQGPVVKPFGSPTTALGTP